MSVSAAIKFTQGATTAPAGQALFGVAGTAVVASNGNDTNVATWTWTWIGVPTGSSVSGGGTASTFSFTPDLPGGYLLELSVEGTDGSVAVDYRCFGVKQPSGRFIPPFQGDSSSLNFLGSLTGWSPIMEAWLQYLDGITGGGFANNATITVPSPPALTRPGSGQVIVPVNLAAAGADTTVLLWPGASVGDLVVVTDAAGLAGKTSRPGVAGLYDLHIDGNTKPVVQWGTQGPYTYASNVGTFRFTGDTVWLRYTQNTGVNSGNPYWWPLQGQ